MGPVEKMTSQPFPVTQQHNGWLISWPSFRDIRRVETKKKLTDLIFDSIGIEEARFSVRLKNGKTKFLHIRLSDWQSPTGLLLNDMLEQYEITGVLFDQEDSAQWLRDYFEKKLMWQKLSQITA